MSDRVCATCGYCDPDTNECWFDERSMSDAEARTRTCKSWEPRKEVPLQPDGSVKMQAKETIGATVVNPESVTRVSLGRLGEKLTEELKLHKMEMNPGGAHQTVSPYFVRRCYNCLHKAGDEMCPGAHDPELEGCKNWEPEPLKATVTFQYEEKQPEDKPSPFEIPKEATEALQYSESDMQEMRGRTLEALDMMTDIALQQMPGSTRRWLSLRKACIHALRNHWKHHDEAIKPYREEAKSHE